MFFVFSRKKMVHYTFQKILSRFDLIFFDEIFDFGSIWRSHRSFNRYILLVVISLPIDQQLCPTIWSLHYWFGCRYLAKTPFLRFAAIFWRGPYGQLFEFRFLNYPITHSHISYDRVYVSSSITPTVALGLHIKSCKIEF